MNVKKKVKKSSINHVNGCHVLKEAKQYRKSINQQGKKKVLRSVSTLRKINKSELEEYEKMIVCVEMRLNVSL